MGRPEKPILSDDEAVLAFAHGLRSLRRRAGTPTYRRMAQAAHYSPAALSRAADGHRLPTWDVTSAYVRACDGDVSEWRARWERARGRTRRVH